ncbi:MAG TPA: cobalt ECF transporter T component CbiQ [Methanospirillum sp.]|uniref:cobalt ECF transporter T component CbiQ n=1 Tax=Methanospirillum sp. TaxID=45200 RepID=UPI002B85C823|nr:cobalt ECF transporter T component CbiQ [Methanospirillum sp.]HOJ97092.1 cobalt ECF transporter T component CbiQ [Methanospirillum sp.]
MLIHDFLEEAAQKNALLLVNPYTKLLLGLGSIVLVLFSPNSITPLVITATLSITTIFFAKIPARFYVKLLSIPLGFAVFSVLAIILLTGGGKELWSFSLFSVLPLSITTHSLQKGLLVFLRIIGGMCALFFISLTTPMTDLFGVMKEVKIPDLFIDLSMIIYRFIFLFMEKTHQIHHAQLMRLGYSKPKEAMRSYSMLFGSIFIRSWDAGENLINAMDCRCYKGKFAKMIQYNPIEIKSFCLVLIYLTGITVLLVMTMNYSF